MTVRRLVILQLVLFAGLGSAYLIPAPAKTQPIGVIMDLPDSIGIWTGASQQITQLELEQLAKDTSFARKVYSNAFGDRILVSIVLAGEDPDNSIHRPERCLPAQGWTIIDSRTVTITTPTVPFPLQVTRLHNNQKFQDEKGDMHEVQNLNYYWFVGYDYMTPSHIDRAITDIRDRVVKGYNQRWAYITVASNVTQGLTKFGRSEAATDEMIQSFVRELFPKIVRPSVLKSDNGQKQVTNAAP